MPATTVLPFPIRPIFRAMRAFHISEGPGHVVAVFFRVPVQYGQHPAGRSHAEGGNHQAENAVGDDL